MTATLHEIPLEILEDIISFALAVHPVPHAIACVNSIWANVALPLLHARICLTERQVHLFVAVQVPLRPAPCGRVVEMRGISGEDVWPLMYPALARCSRDIRVLRVFLRGTRHNPNVIREALCLVNPKVFQLSVDRSPYWEAQPTHVEGLCTAISSWSTLTHLTLAYVSLHHSGVAAALVAALVTAGPRKIVFWQVEYMPPSAVLHIVAGIPHLEELRLVNVCTASTYEVMLCARDVEALLADGAGPSRERVQEVVKWGHGD